MIIRKLALFTLFCCSSLIGLVGCSGFRQPADLSAQGQSSLSATDLKKLLAIQPYGGALCPNAMIPANSGRSTPAFQCITLTFESTTDAPAKLTRDDLQLFEGNRTVPIQYFAQERASIGILVDTSGSMESKLPQAKEAITQFVNDLDPQDALFLFAFSSRAFFLQPFTTNHALLLARLPLLHAQGETAIYDTLLDGILMVRFGPNPRKGLFVITGGYDTASEQRKQDVLAVAQQQNLAVYSIGIGSLSRGWLDTTAVDMETLSELAKATGAKTYNIPGTGNGGELKNDAAAIAAAFDAFGNRYAVGFVARNAVSDSLRLELRNHPGAIVKVEGAAVILVNAAETPTPNVHTH